MIHNRSACVYIWPGNPWDSQSQVQRNNPQCPYIQYMYWLSRPLWFQSFWKLELLSFVGSCFLVRPLALAKFLTCWWKRYFFKLYIKGMLARVCVWFWKHTQIQKMIMLLQGIRFSLMLCWAKLLGTRQDKKQKGLSVDMVISPSLF